ncbi:hypothetical protein COFR110785_11205 [Corynebacterium frankenforstense]
MTPNSEKAPKSEEAPKSEKAQIRKITHAGAPSSGYTKKPVE